MDQLDRKIQIVCAKAEYKLMVLDANKGIIIRSLSSTIARLSQNRALMRREGCVMMIERHAADGSCASSKRIATAWARRRWSRAHKARYPERGWWMNTHKQWEVCERTTYILQSHTQQQRKKVMAIWLINAAWRMYSRETHNFPKYLNHHEFFRICSRLVNSKVRS